jgi:hypothetical protein
LNWFLTYRRNSQHGANGFNSLRKKVRYGFLSPLKNPSLRPGMNPRTLGLMASTLTITLPRRLSSRLTFTQTVPAIVPCTCKPTFQRSMLPQFSRFSLTVEMEAARFSETVHKTTLRNKG